MCARAAQGSMGKLISVRGVGAKTTGRDAKATVVIEEDLVRCVIVRSDQAEGHTTCLVRRVNLSDAGV